MLGAGLADTDRSLERPHAVGGLNGRGLYKQWIDCRRRYSDGWSVVLPFCAYPGCVPAVKRCASELTGHIEQDTKRNKVFAEYVERVIHKLKRICSAINDT